VLRAQDWLTRRLKRHFQDQQTAALRALRAAQQAQDGDQAMPEPSELLDVQAARESASAIAEAALEMAGAAADLAGFAEALEADTLAAVTAALGEPGTAVDRVRDVFRFAIEERAPAAAAALLGQPTQEAA
jgi:hypothetical protein